MDRLPFHGATPVHGMALRFVDLPGGHIKGLVGIGPPFLDAPAPGSKGHVPVRVIRHKIHLYFPGPVACPHTVAAGPSIRPVHFIHDHPVGQRTAISPAGDHIAVEFFLVAPGFLAMIKIFCRGDRVVGVGKPPARGPGRVGQKSMEPDIEAEHHVPVLAQLQQ